MINRCLDILYVLSLLVASPLLIYKAITSGKYRAGLRERFFGSVMHRSSNCPCIWFHAVSVGEVLLLRQIVGEMARRWPEADIVISTTTNTGMEVARRSFADRQVFYFPLDFSWAVSHAIKRIRPDLVVLAELELWPNFIHAAHRFGARIAIINGRMSPRSHRGYRRVLVLMRWLLNRIDLFAVQSSEYARWFVEIGAAPERVQVTGSVKYDGAETDRDNPATSRLRTLLGLHGDAVVWVTGSTSEPEEEMVLRAYEQILPDHPTLRLVIVPRHKERFDEVARLVCSHGLPLIRRSSVDEHHSVDGSTFSSRSGLSPQPVILIDTLGELSAVWGLADIAFVGGSFAPRGGQNMIEPAGYGAAVLFGPGVWNFQDTVDRLLARDAAVQVTRPEQLSLNIADLLNDGARRQQLGAAAREFVLSQQGATLRTVDRLESLLSSSKTSKSAA